MKICVSAPDSKLANLAVLKIAQFHLNKGDLVKWYEPLFDQDCHKLYISKIFTFTQDIVYTPQCEIVKGGTGYDIKKTLPPEIEAITDIRKAYLTLYPDIDYSILFTTRGCVRNCPFCCVPKKEGMIHDVPMVSLNPKGNHIKLLDNNFFSSKSWRNRLNVLKLFNLPIDFTQGIDIRAITDEQCKEIGEVSITRSIHFAWDSIKDERSVMNGIELLTKYVSPSKLTCYCLVGFEKREIVESDHYRVWKLHELGITPFAMGYIDFSDPLYQKSQSVLDFCRWVNRHLFKTIPFDEYKKQQPNIQQTQFQTEVSP